MRTMMRFVAVMVLAAVCFGQSKQNNAATAGSLTEEVCGYAAR